MFLIDAGIRRQLILALTEDSKLHIEEVRSILIKVTSYCIFLVGVLKRYNIFFSNPSKMFTVHKEKKKLEMFSNFGGDWYGGLFYVENAFEWFDIHTWLLSTLLMLGTYLWCLRFVKQLYLKMQIAWHDKKSWSQFPVNNSRQLLTVVYRFECCLIKMQLVSKMDVE